MLNRHSVHVVSGMHEKLKKMGPKFYGPEEHLAIGVVRKQVLSTLYACQRGNPGFLGNEKAKAHKLGHYGESNPGLPRDRWGYKLLYTIWICTLPVKVLANCFLVRGIRYCLKIEL
jgi:hypothetical protein